MPNLVIDANIARSAGGRRSNSRLALACRDILDIIRDAGHSFVKTPDIWEEWERFASPYALSWAAQMKQRRQRVKLTPPMDKDLLNRIKKAVGNPFLNEDIEDDFPYILAAIYTDNRVLSRDNEAREFFVIAAIAIDEIAGIVWINPAYPSDKAYEWVKSGAPIDSYYQLRPE